MLARQFNDMLVSSCQARTPVHKDYCYIRFLERAYGLTDHRLCNTFLAARNAARINYDIWNRAQLAKTVLPVACQAGIVGDNCVTRTRQSIEQRGFANVRPANQCDDRQHGSAASTQSVRRPRRRQYQGRFVVAPDR